MGVTYLAMRTGGLRAQDTPLYGLEVCAPRKPMGASHTQRCGPEARTPRMSHNTGWRPARPGCPMIRAGGPRSQARVAIGSELCGHRMQPEAKSCEPAHSPYRCFHQVAASANSCVSGCNRAAQARSVSIAGSVGSFRKRPQARMK